jgi:molecular chaperone GrpE
MAEDKDREKEEAPNGAEPAVVDEQAALLKELETTKAQAAEYLEGWQRARAEFTNYKRRIEKEQTETYQNATARVMARFVDVLDDFDRAVKDRPVEGDDPAANAVALSQWAAGVALIQRKLQNILEAEGVERIKAEGQAFDPALHEAVTHEDSADHQPGQVIGVVRQGYRIGDRIIRPALVRVAK